jgi:hypothetical protein
MIPWLGSTASPIAAAADGVLEVPPRTRDAAQAVSPISPNAESIRRRLAGMSVIGPEPDLATLSETELGALAALIWEAEASDRFATQLTSALQQRAPKFDASSARAALEALTRRARSGASEREAPVVEWIQRAAAQVIAGCSDPDQPELRLALQELLAEGLPENLEPLSAVLLSCARLAVPSHEDELAQRERSFLCGLQSLRDRITGARACGGWVFGVDDDELTRRGADPLALLPGYLEFALDIVATAVERTRSIQSGAVPYAADKAFTVDGAQVVRRALLAGLDQEQPWALSAAMPLLAGMSKAPDPKVKTVPSQSLSIAIAKAIAERPSSALIAAMSTEISTIRHAGLKAKVARFHQTGQRRLFEQDDFLLELNPALKLPKALTSAVARALEALLVRTGSLPCDVWRARILDGKATSDHAASLIWHFDDVGAALPIRTGRAWTFVDAQGRPLAAPQGRVRLWHPLEVASHAERWRRLVIERNIAQPFNQAFRETYSADGVAEWLGLPLDANTLMGLSRSQGWQLRYDTLVRRIGRYRVELCVFGIFPGAQGERSCTGLHVFRKADSTPLDLSQEDPIGISECLRAVDLLISVSAFTLNCDHAHEPHTARTRRAALIAMLGEDRSLGGAYVDGRNVRQGDVTISIATARASHQGEELAATSDMDPVVIIIPYPDPLLRRIVARLNAQPTSRVAVLAIPRKAEPIGDRMR